MHHEVSAVHELWLEYMQACVAHTAQVADLVFALKPNYVFPLFCVHACFQKFKFNDRSLNFRLCGYRHSASCAGGPPMSYCREASR